MADALPMAQIPNFQLGAQVDPGAFSNAFQKVGSTVGGAFNQGIQNNQAQQALNIQKQQLALQRQKQQQEQGNAIAQNALAAYDAYGDAAGPESFNAFKTGMNMMAPGSVDPNAQWDDSMGEGMKTASKAFDAGTSGARPWPEVIGVISKTIGTLGAQQRAKMQPLLGAAQDQFNQQQSTQRQQSSQTQDTQRAYAEHAQPLLQKGAMLNTVDQLLSQKTPTADAQAKTYIDSALANGQISQADLDQMSTAGNPMQQVMSKYQKWKTGELYDSDHRTAMQGWIGSKRNEINNTLQATATAFPGAQPASVQAPTKTINGKTYVNQGGQWYQQ